MKVNSLSHFIDRQWRLTATAISFLLFGIGGVLIALIVIPALNLTYSDKTSRHKKGKLLIHRLFYLYIKTMKILGVLSYEIHGRERLENAQLVLANHPTLIDVIFLISLIPNANCVVKSALLKNPFTQGPLKAAGYIVNNEAADDVIAAALAAFERNEALIVFPEGSRSIPGKPLTLKRGAANIAVRTKANVTPVTILCEPITLTKGTSWYKIPASRPHFTIKIEAPISANTYVPYDKPSVAARELTNKLVQYFNQETR